MTMQEGFILMVIIVVFLIGAHLATRNGDGSSGDRE